MTEMTTTLLDNSYRNDISSDPLLDLNDFFFSKSGLIHHDEDDRDSMLIEEEDKKTLSSSTISSINNPVQKSLLPNRKCGVCGAPATGYNFNQITCESCKAFFRRNALQDMSRFECRFTGSCVIDIQTRRHCTYCRLKKCFDIQMRKDWIRTKEEIELRQLQKLAKEQKRLNKLTNTEQPLLHLPIVMRKKKRLMIKPTFQESVVKPIDRQTLFGFNRHLSDNDRMLLNNITNAYQLAVDQVDGYRLQKWTSSLSLIQFINEQTIMPESLISFYKSIPEFNQLDMRDRISLIKFNLIEIVPLHGILMDKFQEHPLIGFHVSQWVNEDFHNRMSRTRVCFNRFIEHPLVLKVALIVLIFSMNLSTSYSIDSRDNYTNSINIREIQDSYTTILWRYLNCLFGEREAIRLFGIIVAQILHYQTLTNIMEGYVRQQPDRNTFHQLESSLFRLT